MQKDKIFAVIDTNVLVSAYYTLQRLSNPTIILNNIFNKNITPIYNHEIIEEYKEVLSRSKFNFQQQLIDELIDVVLTLGVKINKKEFSAEDFPDPKDIIFYEVKMSKEDSYLVMGNIKHFPQDPMIVTPAEMVEILKEKGLLNEF
ncbi:MAG: putative toxin-antitoxin system toxin component, PIN family [Muribaculaceae bacterium]|nr:putative toxin-antitoxin system toxin component, PIN family [Muribaculaceae bacterium]